MLRMSSLLSVAAHPQVSDCFRGYVAPFSTNLRTLTITLSILLALWNFCLTDSEFNEEQRNVFCVFSGDGVHRFRDYMNQEALNSHHDGDLVDDITMYDDGLPEDDGISHSLQDMTIDAADEDGYEGEFESPFQER